MPLTQHHANLWTLDFPLQVLGVPMGARSTLVRLPSGDLWLHSPVRLGAEDVREINTLGPVRHLVAPNLVHHLFLPAAQKLWPEAKVYAPQGLEKKRKDTRIDEQLGETPPDSWQDVLSVVPLRGMPRVKEHVFVHAPSRTAIACDIVFNMRQPLPMWPKLFMQMNHGYMKFGPTRILRSTIAQPEELRPDLDRLLQHDFDRLTMAHGQVLETNARQELREAFAWLK